MSLPTRLAHLLSFLTGLLLLVVLSFSGHNANLATAASESDPLTIFLNHLDQNRADYGLVPTDLTDYIVTDLYQTSDTGVTHVYLRQQINGIDLLTSHANANILPDGSILSVNVAFTPNLDRSLHQGQPALTAAETANAVAEELHLPISEYFFVQESFDNRPDQAAILTDGGISKAPIPARLVYIETERGEVRLAWELLIAPINRVNYWQIAADAETGEILVQFDWVVEHNMADIALSEPRPLIERSATTPPTRATNTTQNNALATDALLTGTYRVFPFPYESPTDPGAGHNLVANPAHPVASPFGWHDTNGADGAEHTTTQGNNVHAYLDADANDLPDPGSSPDGGAGLVFDFAFDPALEPTGGTNAEASVVNMFYWSNISHDLLYMHGFDEASGNFQVNNYGRGGLGGDYLLAEGLDGSGINNAFFGTPPDGNNPRMLMYRFTFTTPNRDSSFDAGVVAHEYGHGWSNRLTGGPSNVSCLQNTEQMGEGWSDYLATVFTAQASDTRTTNRGMGTYVLGQSPDGIGIRPAPYTTDMGVNGYNYANRNDANISIPHGVGFIWNTMLWEMYWNLVDEYGFNPNLYEDWQTGGNNLALRLVSDGLKLQPCSPGFVDGRDAILAADIALTGGENQCLIWDAFAKRGLGVSADQGTSDNRADGTAAFDMPESCTFLNAQPPSTNICQGAEGTFNISAGNSFTQDVTLSHMGNPATSIVTFVPNPLTPGNEAVMTVGNTNAVPFGSYDITVTGDDTVVTKTATVELTVFDQVPNTAVLLQPTDAADDVSFTPTLSWTASAQTETYLVEVATDADFTNIVSSKAVADTQVDLSGLDPSTVYYWRVAASNSCGTAVASATFSFRTQPLPGDCRLEETTHVLFSEDFENGATGWTSGGTGSTWAASNVRVHGGATSFLAVNSATTSDQRLMSPPVEITPGFDNYALSFWNYQSIESGGSTGCWDGALIEISTDAGGSWTQLSSSNHLYDGVASTDNPLADLPTWCGDPRDWHRPAVALDDYVGETVNFRFRLGTDGFEGREGWYVDDIAVQACEAPTAGVTFGADQTQTALPSTTVTYTVPLTNSGSLQDVFDLNTANANWDTAVSPSSIELAAGATGTVTVTAVVPAGALAGEQDVVQLTAVSRFDDQVSATTTLTTTTETQHGFVLTSDLISQTVAAGQPVTYTVSLTNTGNISDSYDIALSGHSWDSTASMSQMGMLAPGETAQFTVRVAVPAEALPDSSDLVLVQVASVADDEITAVLNLTTAVLPQVEFNLYLPLVTQP